MYHSIFEIVPKFKLTGQIDASLKVSDIEVSVDMKYDFSGVNFDFFRQADSQASALLISYPSSPRNVQSMDQTTNTE